VFARHNFFIVTIDTVRWLRTMICTTRRDQRVYHPSNVSEKEFMSKERSLCVLKVLLLANVFPELTCHTIT